MLQIIDVIIYHGRQAIAYRGHRDDFKYYPPVGESSYKNNPGNFVETLNLVVRYGDKVLEEHLKSAPHNARYTSAPIQNELISLCGKFITDKIVDEIKAAKFFTILADEVIDNSGKEQLALVIRFVEEGGIVREEFLKFILCDEGVSGQQLAEYILLAVNEFGLDTSNCRGQGYYGAPSMSGKDAGCYTFILGKCSKAFYFHCFSHRLNLCVQGGLQIECVRTMLHQISGITNYFAQSEPRKRSFRRNILQDKADKIIFTDRMELFDVCKTRWVARIEGLVTFCDLIKPMLSCFQDLQLRVPRDVTSQIAGGFLDKISDFKFVVCLIITMRIMSITFEVTRLLQEKELDIVKGFHLLTTLNEDIKSTRAHVEHYHNEYYDQALKLAQDITVQKKILVEEEVPRVVSKQLHRCNTPGSNPREYFKYNITI